MTARPPPPGYGLAGQPPALRLRAALDVLLTDLDSETDADDH